MKIETLLTISEKMKDGKKKEMGRVKDLTDEELGKLNRDRFKEGKSQRGKTRLESRCFVILKEDFEDYEREINSKIQSLESTIEDKDKSIESLENRLSSIDEEHSKEIKKIDDEYSERIAQLNEELHGKDIEKEEVKTKYEKEIGELKESNQIKINGLELFDEDKHMKIKEYYSKISGIKDSIARETIHHNDNINELEKSLKFKNYIRGHHKSEIMKLKEDIEQFRLIAQYIESEEKEIVQDVKKEDGK